jgi:hypothetical protein
MSASRSRSHEETIKADERPAPKTLRHPRRASKVLAINIEDAVTA